jgi:hypothetical protein
MGWLTNLLGTFERTFTLGRGSTGPGVLDTSANSASRTYTLQDAAGVVAMMGPVITSTATGNQNDFNPSALATASVLRLNPASALTITGLDNPSFAKEIVLANVSSSITVTLTDEDVASTAAKRFAFGGNATIAPNQTLLLVYDPTSARWRTQANATVTINDLTEDTAPDRAADFVPTWDTSAAITKKVLLSKILEGATVRTVVSDAPSANANDYNPTNLASASILRIAPSASIKLTGLQGGVAGRELTLINAATDFLLWLENENTASTAANRFVLPNGFPAFLMPGDTLTLSYDGTSSRWRVTDWPMRGQAMGLIEFSDFVGSTLGPFTSTVSGTGASAQASAYLMDTTERSAGITQIDTGTTATGRATVGSAGTDQIVPTLGAALSVARLAQEAANSGTETYQLITGFADSAGGTFTDGAAWNLRWNGSAQEWSQDRLANATATRSVTGSPTPDNNYIWLVVFVNPAWTRADFIYSTDSIAFTKADSPTTGLPGNTRDTAWVAASMIKSVGTTQRNASIDLAGYRIDYVRG